MRVIDRVEVRTRLSQDMCIPIIREAMIAFSSRKTFQLLRSMLPVGEGHLLGVMPGGLGIGAAFGAKLVSVFPTNATVGGQSHQGVVVLFDGQSGAPVCIV